MEMDSESDQEDEINGQERGERLEAHITCTTVHWLCHNMFELRIYADIVGLQYCKLIMQHQFAVNCIVYCKLAFCLSL